jgi:hypothetical protein
MRYELDFYIPEGDIPHIHHRDNLKYFTDYIKINARFCASFKLNSPKLLEL